MLDISPAALAAARTRLTPCAGASWIAADLLQWQPARQYDVWHDRAVFHFLTTPDDRERYRTHLLQTLKPGGSAIVATFALDGPEMCSGLPVQRYSAAMVAAELGDDFELVEGVRHVHTTPWGSTQPFQYCRFTRSH